MSKSDSKKQETPPERQVPFVCHGLFGGTAGAIGICIIQPMDLIKTRMQLLGEQGKKGNVFAVTRDIIKKDGFLSLWDGVSCSVLRQYTYGLTRFTVFYNLYDLFKRKYGETPRPIHKLGMGMCAGACGAVVGNPSEVCLIRMTAEGSLPPEKRKGYTSVFNALFRKYGETPRPIHKLGMGMCAGACGAVVGNPSEVCLIRMTAEGSLPPEKRKGYTSVFNALFRIAREEGLKTLWTGVEATMTRGMIVSAAELGSYTQAREFLLRFLGEGIQLHFAASMVAGLVATTASLPVDIVKTRVQNTPGGKASQITVLKDILKNEGVKTLWSGYLPTYLKLGPHAVLQFVIFEQFIMLYWKFVTPTSRPLVGE